MTRAVGRFGDKTRVSIPAMSHISDEQKRRASLEVGRQALDVEDCRELLGMLGLLPTAVDRAAVDPQHTANTVIQAATDTGGPA